MLSRLTCDTAKLSAEQTLDFSREYLYNDTFTIKPTEYLMFFKSSYERKCPITDFKFATENGGFTLYTTIEGLITIDSKGVITFNFLSLWSLPFSEMEFWLVGKTDANMRAYMPLKMKKKVLPKPVEVKS